MYLFGFKFAKKLNITPLTGKGMLTVFYESQQQKCIGKSAT